MSWCSRVPVAAARAALPLRTPRYRPLLGASSGKDLVKRLKVGFNIPLYVLYEEGEKRTTGSVGPALVRVLRLQTAARMSPLRDFAPGTRGISCCLPPPGRPGSSVPGA